MYERQRYHYIGNIKDMKTERELVITVIASILDYPSVYMSGPSENNKRRAEKIVKYFEQSHRLKPSDCKHDEYAGFKRHGLYCPTCDMVIFSSKEEAESKYPGE